jgi:tRNA(Arg) A34 adenosine deaminase TadA
MRICLEEAIKNNNEIPVGAIIIDSKNNIVSRKHNLCYTTKDPTAHAEILAIREACTILNTNNLSNCSIFVTLEPCAMCSIAISYSRIANIYYGAYDVKFGAIDSNLNIFNTKLALYKPNIYSGIMEEDCKFLLQQFFQDKRL